MKESLPLPNIDMRIAIMISAKVSSYFLSYHAKVSGAAAQKLNNDLELNHPLPTAFYLVSLKLRRI